MDCNESSLLLAIAKETISPPKFLEIANTPLHFLEITKKSQTFR